MYTYVYNSIWKVILPDTIFYIKEVANMSFAKKHKKGVIDWGVDTKDFEYFKLSDLYWS